MRALQRFEIIPYFSAYRPCAYLSLRTFGEGIGKLIGGGGLRAEKYDLILLLTEW